MLKILLDLKYDRKQFCNTAFRNLKVNAYLSVWSQCSIGDIVDVYEEFHRLFSKIQNDKISDQYVESQTYILNYVIPNWHYQSQYVAKPAMCGHLRSNSKQSFPFLFPISVHPYQVGISSVTKYSAHARQSNTFFLCSYFKQDLMPFFITIMLCDDCVVYFFLQKVI